MGWRGPHKILAIGEPGPQRGRQTQLLSSPYEWLPAPPHEAGNQPHQYWPFSTSDLYNWRFQNAKVSDNPRDLTNLLETVLFTHQPTWDDCQQLLQILFTTEERENTE